MSASVSPIEITFRYHDSSDKVTCNRGNYSGDPKLLIQNIAPEFGMFARLANRFTLKTHPDSLNKENMHRIYSTFKAVIEARRRRSDVERLNNTVSGHCLDLAAPSLREVDNRVNGAQASFKKAQRETGIEVLLQMNREISPREFTAESATNIEVLSSTRRFLMSENLPPVEISFTHQDQKISYNRGSYPEDPKLLLKDIAFEFRKLVSLAKQFTFKANLACFTPENVSRVSLAFKDVLDAKKRHAAQEQVHKYPFGGDEINEAKEILQKSQTELDAAEAAFQKAKRETGIEVLFEETS